MSPHDTTPLLHAGVPVETAAAVVILVHGRGSNAKDFLSVSRWIDCPGAAYLAPQAAGNTWYPQSFLSPMEQNQPGIDSGIARLETIVTDLLGQQVPSNKILLVGFSQGACLTSEFTARHPRRYGGVAALTGGLIGPRDTPRRYGGVAALTGGLIGPRDTPRRYAGSLEGTPVFLGASDPDPHVPWWRVEETSTVLTQLGASVEVVRYANQPHMINEDQVAHVQALVRAVLDQ